jgi:hypothetical protein
LPQQIAHGDFEIAFEHVFSPRKLMLNHQSLSNNHALLFFQKVTPAWNDAIFKKLSAGMTVRVRQRTVGGWNNHERFLEKGNFFLQARDSYE